MAKIRIVTDSTADLPQEIAEQYQITVIPLTVFINGKGYLDRVDIGNEDFYLALQSAQQLPTTSQPSPAVFADCYNKLADEGAEEIISIHLSSDLSGTLQSAVLAKGMVADKIKVNVIDSRSATMGLGLIVLTAAKAAKENKNIEEILNHLDQAVRNLDLLFLLDSLDNLQKGGRIGKASFLVGSLLNIKPILRLKDGVIGAYEKVRGNKENKALERLIDILIERIEPGKKVYCAIGYCDNIETAQYLVSRLQEKINCDEFVYMQIGNVVITHIGMGAVGMAFYQL